MSRVLQAFSEDQAARLAKVSQRQLAYWDRTDFFKPSMADENRRLKYSRTYTFNDIVGLRTLSALINEYGVSVKYLRKVRELLKKPQDVWANTTLYILGKKVYLEEPSSASFREPTSGQLTLRNLPMRRIVDDVTADVIDFQSRRTSGQSGVTSKKYVVRNAQVIEGTRVPISAVKEYFDEGFSFEDILSEFPSLTKEDLERVEHFLRRGAA